MAKMILYKLIQQLYQFLPPSITWRLHAMQSFRSSDKNIIAGISVGWFIYN